MRELRLREGRPRVTDADTDEEPLPGGETDDFSEFKARGLELGVVPESVEHLISHYGTEAAGIYNLGAADRRLMRRLVPPHPAIEAEVLHAVRRELAQTVEDVMVRRTHLYYEHPERGIPAAKPSGGAHGTGAAAGTTRAVDGRGRPLRRRWRGGERGPAAGIPGALGRRLDDHPPGHADAVQAAMTLAVVAEVADLVEGEGVRLGPNSTFPLRPGVTPSSGCTLWARSSRSPRPRSPSPLR